MEFPLPARRPPTCFVARPSRGLGRIRHEMLGSRPWHRRRGDGVAACGESVGTGGEYRRSWINRCHRNAQRHHRNAQRHHRSARHARGAARRRDGWRHQLRLSIAACYDGIAADDGHHPLDGCAAPGADHGTRRALARWHNQEPIAANARYDGAARDISRHHRAARDPAWSCTAGRAGIDGQPALKRDGSEELSWLGALSVLQARWRNESLADLRGDSRSDVDRFPSLLRQLELDRRAGLSLANGCAIDGLAMRRDILYA
jgi:hypothetical protein